MADTAVAVDTGFVLAGHRLVVLLGLVRDLGAFLHGAEIVACATTLGTILQELDDGRRVGMGIVAGSAGRIFCFLFAEVMHAQFLYLVAYRTDFSLGSRIEHSLVHFMQVMAVGTGQTVALVQGVGPIVYLVLLVTLQAGITLLLCCVTPARAKTEAR